MRSKTLLLLSSFCFVTLPVWSADTAPVPYPPISGSYTGEPVAQSPDPLVNYRWESPKATDDLQIYTLAPVSVTSDNESAVTQEGGPSKLRITGPCDLMFDFGRVSAAWLEFDSEDLNGEVEMSISEFNEPAFFNIGSQHPSKTARPVKYGNTYRLELNDQLYEGVRFGWIHIKRLNKPVTISDVRLVCQVKPTNYEGSFACSDTLLTRIWYTGAYTVKTNLLKDYFGAILMERSDRHSWTGDAHTSQGAALVAFGNYDFVKANLLYTSTQFNGIASYSLYWVLSLVDYYLYTGDRELLDQLLDNACQKMDLAYEHYGQNPALSFYGWDERLGGFEDPGRGETQNAYKMLSIQVWNAFSLAMREAGYSGLAEKYAAYAAEKVRELRADRNWFTSFGVHAATDAVNGRFITAGEYEGLWKTAFADRQQRLSYSPFNQYFIISAMAHMGRYSEALTTVDDCWGGQIRYGATTFFEVFRPSWNEISQPNDAPVNNQCGYTSFTHPWSAGITKWLTEEILGIKPTSPGFLSFSVKPHLTGKVTWVKGKVKTPHGMIDAYFDIMKGMASVEVPAGTVARVGVPKAGREIKKITFDKGRPEPEWEDQEYIYYELPSGNYSMDIEYSGQPAKLTEEPFVYALKADAVEDTQTKGNWIGKYGSKGYFLCHYDGLEGHRVRLPEFVRDITFQKEGKIHWQSGTEDRRALLSDRPQDESRSIGAIATQDSLVCMQTMTIDIPGKDSRNYQLSLYFVDWEEMGRRSAIEIFDLESKELLAPVYMVRDYQNGKYVTFQLDRPVRLRIDQVRGSNAALSGLFFD